MLQHSLILSLRVGAPFPAGTVDPEPRSRCSLEDLLPPPLSPGSLALFSFFFFHVTSRFLWRSPPHSPPPLSCTPCDEYEGEDEILQQISSPARKTASWLPASVLQVLSSQPEFLSAIT